ncbi:hypothetical protein L0F63_006766 [Massospora cicadina]|nr:hypothetical protein L0F63_006766 [Massospora cicadina]
MSASQSLRDHSDRLWYALACLSCGGLSSVPKTTHRGGPVSGSAPAWPAHPLLPPNFPESPCSDISKLFNDTI